MKEKRITFHQLNYKLSPKEKGKKEKKLRKKGADFRHLQRSKIHVILDTFIHVTLMNVRDM